MRGFLDSSTIILGLERKGSNSSAVLHAAAAALFEAVANEAVIDEVRRHFRPRMGRHALYVLENRLRASMEVCERESYQDSMSEWRGRIKDKDLDHLVTVKHFGIPRLVAFDRDYAPFPEYRTPRQFAIELGLRPAATEY